MGPPPGNAKQGLTVLEVLLSAVLLAAALAAIVAVVFGGGRSYARARQRLDVIGSCRASLERIRADVTRAAGDVEVSDDGSTLTLGVLELDGQGLPRAASDGKFQLERIRYVYEPEDRQLLRNGKVVGRGIPDLELSQRVHDSGRRKWISVEARVTAVVDGKPIAFGVTAVPRLVASWARDPGWVFTTVGAPYEFEIE